MGGRADFLCPYICSRVCGLMRFRDGSDSECASNFVQISDKVWRKSWQRLDKRSGNKAWVVHGCLKGMLRSGQTEKVKTSVEQSQEHAHHFLWHQRDCSQRIRPWQARQSIPHTIMTFYGHCVKVFKDFAPNFGDKRTDCCIRQHIVSHFFFHHRIFYQKQNDCRPPPNLLFCFSD
jgi:hypothetical protein